MNPRPIVNQDAVEMEEFIPRNKSELAP